MNFIKKLESLIPSIYLNFKCLPYSQAIKLPILVNKPHFFSLKGKIRIEAEEITHGMIQLGFLSGSAYPNNGITFNINGSITFKGRCRIGNDSYLIIDKGANVVIEDDFLCNAGLKLVSIKNVYFGKSCRLGWGVVVMDTGFHPLYDLDKNCYKKPYGEISIGDYNWFGMQCWIMPGVKTPERCIFGGRTVVNKGATFEPYCVHGGSPIRILSRNVIRKIGEDRIEDYERWVSENKKLQK